MERKKKEEKRIKDEDLFKVVDSTIDTRTYLNIIQVSRRLKIESIYGAISSGKEAKVYPARTVDGNWIALKIYYVSTAQSKRALMKYTLGDPRFESVKVTNTRQLVVAWARKEFANLEKMYSNGVRVPKPYLVYENVLAMQFIGEDGVRAPLLKELADEEVTEEIYNDLLEQLKAMVQKAQLVHGDLSEYNVMVFDGLPYIIDVSQAVSVKHENAKELLLRDIVNISNFFSSKGVSTKDPSTILGEIWIWD